MTPPKLVRVAALGGTYRIDGKTYGPSVDPIRIPGHLAAALGLPEFDPEAEAEAEQATSQTAAEAQGLQAELTRSQEWAESLQEELRKATAAASAQLTVQADQIQGLKVDLDAADKQIEQLQAELEAARVQNQTTGTADPSLPLLPPDALDRLIAVKGIAPNLAQKALDALTAPAAAPAAEPQP